MVFIAGRRGLEGGSMAPLMMKIIQKVRQLGSVTEQWYVISLQMPTGGYLGLSLEAR